MIASRISMSPTCRRAVFSPRLARLPSKRSSTGSLQRPSDVPRSRPSRYWSLSDLASFNIHLKHQDALDFFDVFDVEQLPEPAVDPELLNVRDAGAMKQDRHAELITLCDLIMLSGRHDSTVPFLVTLFDVLGYTRRHRVACGWKELPLHMCGKWMDIKTELCLLDYSFREPNDVRLLVQKHRPYYVEGRPGVDDPRAQLVALAIAAFTENNIRRASAEQGTLAEKVMPGIIMEGTVPMFFKIPVSQTLLKHIARGTYPRDATTVTFCEPPVPRPAGGWTREAMRALDARRAILSCYEAFKTVIGI